MRTSPIPRSLVNALAVATLLPTAALAQTPPPAAPPAPDYTLTANVGLFSEYIFRGISQTAGKPAVQGGFDWAHSSGFYLGTWGSNISWLEDFGAYTRSSLEWDFYGGYKGSINDDWNYDLGTIYYLYPGNAIPATRTPTAGSSTARSTGNGSAPRLRTTSTTTSAQSPSGKRRTARGISTSTPTIRSGIQE